MNKAVVNGIYKHNKTQGLYLALENATDLDTSMSVIIYQSYKDNKIWIRDTEVFFDKNRFEYIGIAKKRNILNRLRYRKYLESITFNETQYNILLYGLFEATLEKMVILQDVNNRNNIFVARC